MNKYLLPFILALAFFITGIFTLPDYGINWDSPGHFLRGQALASYLLTGVKSYQTTARLSPVLIKPDEYISRYSFAAIEDPEGYLAKLPNRPLPQKEFRLTQEKLRTSFYQSQDWNGNFFLNIEGGSHLPLVDIFSSFLNKLLYQGLGIFADIDSYQLGYILISSMGIFIVTIFVYEITNSILAMFIAALCLGLFPFFFAESHMNLKDPPQAAFYAASLWSFWHWVKSTKKWWGVASILFVILALGIKWNIVFLPIILLPWLFIIRNDRAFKQWFKVKLFLFALLFIICFFLFLTIIWPSSILNPLEKFWSVSYYYLQIGLRTDLLQPKGFILPFNFNIYPLILVVTQTPSIILLLVIAAIIAAFKHRFDSQLKVGHLLILWLFIPIIRVILPHIWFYSGFRQIMEILPAMAIMAGVGANYLVRVISDKYSKGNKLVTPILVLVTSYLLLVPIIKLHPNQNAYFNILAGGLKGAVNKNLIDWTLTNGNIYKQGALWLDKNGEKDANLAHLDGSMFAISPMFLRQDISISPYHFSGFDQKGEYIMTLFNPLDPPVFAQRYPKRFLDPIQRIKVDGVNLLYIYKNDPAFLKSEFRQEQKKDRVPTKQVRGVDRDYFELDFKKDVLVTKIIMIGILKNCLKADNDLLAFRSLNQLKEKIDPSEVYTANEKKDLGNGRVEFSFPAEKAKAILIYPLNSDACSLQTKIFDVSYFEEK